MTLSLLFPISILLAVPAVAFSVLRSDGRGRKLEERVTGIAAPTSVSDIETATPRLRLVEARRGDLVAAFRRLVQLPENLPEARKFPVPVVIIFGILVGCAAGGFAKLYLPTLLDVVSGMGVGLMVIRSIFVSEARSYAKKLRKQMPDMIELVVSATLAGLPVSEGFAGVSREISSPTKEEFQRISRDIALGVSVEEAMMRLFRRTHVAEYAIFAVTLGVQSRSGGKLSEVIMRLADTVRQRIAIAERAGAMAAEAKLSAYVLSVLPFVSIGLMAVIQPEFMTTLLWDPRGQHLLFIGGVLMIGGWFTMKQMIAKATTE
jgi:tight adherence protein B